ncbi:MAG: hypothetical protein JXA13_17185 [Anaerolineales bacterium]|nr:hypothetical protein [Anaerolineales bacterium]
MQGEHITRSERAALAQVERLHPDLIVLTGSYLHLDHILNPQSRQETHWMLSQLEAPFGSYAVSSPVDDPETNAVLFAALDIALLDDRIERITFPGGDLYLAGVNNPGYARDRAILAELVQGYPAGCLSTPAVPYSRPGQRCPRLGY